MSLKMPMKLWIFSPLFIWRALYIPKRMFEMLRNFMVLSLYEIHDWNSRTTNLLKKFNSGIRIFVLKKKIDTLFCLRHQCGKKWVTRWYTSGKLRLDIFLICELLWLKARVPSTFNSMIMSNAIYSKMYCMLKPMK